MRSARTVPMAASQDLVGFGLCGASDFCPGFRLGSCRRTRRSTPAAHRLRHFRRYGRGRRDFPHPALRAGLARPPAHLGTHPDGDPEIQPRGCAQRRIICPAGAFGRRRFLRHARPSGEPLPLTVWTLGWGGLPVAHALFGNLWVLLNPWIAPSRLLRRLVGASNPPLAYPRWLGRWPAVLTFFAFAWFVLVDPA